MITLHPHSMRTQNKLDYLHKQSIDPILINGVNGYKLPNHIIKTHVSSSYTSIGPKSAIGCALSHFKVWRTFLKTNAPYCIVFEDDVIVSKSFNTKLQKIINDVPSDFHLLYLGCFNSKFFKNVFSLFNLLNTHRENTQSENTQSADTTTKSRNKNIVVPKVALAAHAYIISRKGATLLLSLLDGKLFNHLDICLQTLSTRGLIKTFACKPRLAFQSSTDNVIESSNAPNSHPVLFNYLLSRFFIDKKVRANYATTCSLVRIGSINLTVSSILIFILGYLSLPLLNLNQLTLYYALLSIPDFLNKADLNVLLFHYFLFIIPHSIQSLE